MLQQCIDPRTEPGREDSAALVANEYHWATGVPGISDAEQTQRGGKRSKLKVRSGDAEAKTT
jgi:hypothetical protein